MADYKLETIKGKVISYCDIPEDISQDSYISECGPDCYIKYSLDSNDKDYEELDKWIAETYPELIGTSFFINIDY